MIEPIKNWSVDEFMKLNGGDVHYARYKVLEKKINEIIETQNKLEAIIYEYTGELP